jgi:hypothetical protein
LAQSLLKQVGCGKTVLLVVSWLALAGVGCFTDPINRPPVVSGLGLVSPFVRGQPAWFTATVTDPDSDQGPISPTWAYVPEACPSDTSAANRPTNAQALPPETQFMVPSDVTLARFCVWVFARDRFGALDVKFLEEDPVNRPPVVQIDVISPTCVVASDPSSAVACTFGLYASFVLSAAGSTDPEGDALTGYTWTLDSKPPGSNASPAPCQPSTDDRTCFSADQPGQYRVSVAVSDSQQGQTDSMITLSVAEDQPPCIRTSTPLYLNPLVIRNPMEDAAFSVDRVDDDGDPYPATATGETHFTWYVGHGTLPLVTQDNDFHSLNVGAESFVIGETGRVRVEIHDRKVPAIDDVLLGCGDAAVCAARPGCFQRVTWDLEYLQ